MTNRNNDQRNLVPFDNHLIAVKPSSLVRRALVLAEEMLSPLREFKSHFTGMIFIPIPAGNFMMGNAISALELVNRYGGKEKWYENEHPQHKVTITKPFYLQTTQVTQGQWKRIMGNNPSYCKVCGDDCPVNNVSWEDTQNFINQLNEIEGTEKYRLPTESEWEYACRAGSTTEFCYGNDKGKIGEYAWYDDNSKEGTQPVGQKKPNTWGLYDMHGNVCEWCHDWFEQYPLGHIIDPKGPPSEEYTEIYEEMFGVEYSEELAEELEQDYGKDGFDGRVLRGGSWRDNARFLRSTYRLKGGSADHDDNTGFRVAVDF